MINALEIAQYIILKTNKLQSVNPAIKLANYARGLKIITVCHVKEPNICKVDIVLMRVIQAILKINLQMFVIHVSPHV